MGIYADEVTGFREKVHQELIHLGLTSPDQIQQADQAKGETGGTSQTEPSTSDPTTPTS
jgi:hypothetical protein